MINILKVRTNIKYNRREEDLLTITIPTEAFNRIMSVIGYPVLSLVDLTGNSTITEDDLKTLLIWPAMQEYFRWFPVRNAVEYDIGTSYDFAFPNDNTFGVIDGRFVQSTNTGQKTGSPFVDGLLFSNSHGQSHGMYGTVNDYGMTAARYTEEAQRQSQINHDKSFRIRINKVERRAQGYSNYTGRVVVTWAEYSDNWSSVLFERESEVIDLARANVLDYFGALRNQSNAGLPTELTGDDFISTAKELREEVLDTWRTFTKPIVLRS